MEELYEAGYCKAIGVSNFEVKHLKNILDNCKIVPHVNQIGYFIGIDQSETIDFCKLNNIFIEAYSPLGIGYLLSNKTINQIAKKYEVSPAQICIRYLLQKEVCPLPKSIHEDRMIQNTIVDFIISDEDMKILDQVKGDPRRWS
jgi:diketogulonate reductase-like aldo/keto reductase